jgi:protoheme IX farnesyltransferase
MSAQKKPVWQEYWELCKPRVVALMIITLWVGMALVGERLSIPTSLFIATTLGVAAMASSGAALNHIIDVKIDAKMNRTKNRPLPSGNLNLKQATIFAVSLGVLGFFILLLGVNVLTAMLTLFTTVGYGVFYTAFLKRQTSQNIVIGGLFGAMPPLLGWTAVANVISSEAILLVLIIFTWTPAHFWALALHRIDDYRKIDIPMLPVTHGIPYTKLHIVLYTVLTIVASVLPYVSNMFGFFYCVGALILGARFLYWAIRLYQSKDQEYAMATFRFSNVYLMVLFLLMWVDHILIGYV